MYLRLGWVVGNVGLRNALIIISISNLITIFTCLSVASIATNMEELDMARKRYIAEKINTSILFLRDSKSLPEGGFLEEVAEKLLKR